MLGAHRHCHTMHGSPIQLQRFIRVSAVRNQRISIAHCACEAIGTCRFHIRLKIQFDGSRCIDLWRRFYLGRRHSFAHTPNNCGVKNGELMAIHTHVKCATSSANLFFFSREIIAIHDLFGRGNGVSLVGRRMWNSMSCRRRRRDGKN